LREELTGRVVVTKLVGASQWEDELYDQLISHEETEHELLTQY
jgi:hypothetical protein